MEQDQKDIKDINDEPSGAGPASDELTDRVAAELVGEAPPDGAPSTAEAQLRSKKNRSRTRLISR